MANPIDEDPVTLCVVGTEVEATMIADALTDRGVDARASGVMTGGFRAEAPGSVKILVHASELQKARAVLEAYRREQSDIDWDAVDVGEPE